MPATTDRTLLLIIGAALLAVAGAFAAWFALSPAEPSALEELPAPSVALVGGFPSPPATIGGEVVVDVEGAVATPGLHRLPAGARVADALDAAGGYAPDADLETAARLLNLAAPLTDGQQVIVPRLGEAAGSSASASAPTGAGGGGLVNLNTASPEELDALPGIGPVTVQKIVAARQEAPFATLDDAVARDVMNSGQLEKIRDLATV